MTNPSDMSNAELADGLDLLELEHPAGFVRENSVLLESASRLRAMEWQPIETAPQGQSVLLYVPPFDPMQGVMRSDGSWMVGARSIMGRVSPSEPTHWMPLPSLPEPKAE